MTNVHNTQVGTSCVIRENTRQIYNSQRPWWRHDMETLAALTVPLWGLCHKGGVMRSFAVFFDVSLKEPLNTFDKLVNWDAWSSFDISVLRKTRTIGEWEIGNKRLNSQVQFYTLSKQII